MNCSRCGFADDGSTAAYSCPSCGGLYSSNPEVKQIVPDMLWESKFAKEYPFTSFLKTVKEIILKPEHFFRNLSNESTILSSWLFALVAGSIGYTGHFVWSLLFPNLFSDLYDNSNSLLSNGNSSAETLLFTPLIITFEIWILTLFVQCMVTITRVKGASIKTTFKVVSYAQSAILLQIIPVIGTLFSSIYMCVLLLTGLNQKHHSSKLKLFFILILPFIFVAGFAVFVLIFILLFGIASTGFIDKIIPFLSK